jgi:hypothetical protein
MCDTVLSQHFPGYTEENNEKTRTQNIWYANHNLIVSFGTEAWTNSMKTDNSVSLFMHADYSLDSM